MCVGILHGSKSVYHVCTGHVEARRGGWIPWGCSYRPLAATMWRWEFNPGPL